MTKQKLLNAEIAIKFGERVRQLRIGNTNLSQEELATRAGLHRTFIGRVERGETNITLGNIARLLSALKVSLAEFFESFEEVYEQEINTQ
jgi:transcriptional regulator with XRE-family HTH domain